MRPPGADVSRVVFEFQLLMFSRQLSDRLYQGRRFRTLKILDEGVRETLAIEMDTSLLAGRMCGANSTTKIT
jgi:hypothetical protein